MVAMKETLLLGHDYGGFAAWRRKPLPSRILALHLAGAKVEINGTSQIVIGAKVEINGSTEEERGRDDGGVEKFAMKEEEEKP
ncbi:hypothetical protein Fmac_002920 [Flemingia macrophylla]|uniref:Uncharacterized protein n=1 Tax=Flemingia macrophylla TaxID=520843 RepID=A0ABD1NP59_9FABA